MRIFTQEAKKQVLFRSRSNPGESQKLVDAALAGDSEAMEGILGALRDHLAKRVRFELARRNFYLMEGEDEDLVQDVIIQIWTTDLARFDECKSSLAHFATKRLRWMLIDRIRARARVPHLSLDRMRDDGVPDPTDPGGTAITRLSDAEYERSVEQVIPLLLRAAAAHNDDTAATIIKRYDVDGVALKQIAVEVDLHPANVTRARQRVLGYAARHAQPQAFFAA